jgi:HlyD family secretion protein
LRIRAYFDEPDIGKLAAGQPVSIKWEAKYGKIWHGHVDVAPTTVIAYGTRNVGEALITVDDADGELKPYANVTVTVTTSQLHHVLVIPHEALRTQGGSNFVFIVRDGRLVRTPVQVGMSNYTLVQITGGLSSGDTVALGATTNRDLSAGLRVAPVDEAHE